MNFELYLFVFRLFVSPTFHGGYLLSFGHFLDLDYIIIRFKTNYNIKTEKKRIFLIFFIYFYVLNRYYIVKKKREDFYMARGRGKATPQDKEAMIFISNKINQLLSENNLKQSHLADILEIPRSSFNEYVKGNALPKPGNVQKIADYFGLFKSDIDPRFKSDKSISSPTPQVLHLDRELKEPRHSAWIANGEELLAEQTAEQNKATPLFDNQLEEEQLFEVRGTTFSAAASGFGRGYEADDYDTYTVYTDEEPPTKYDYAIGIRGDSMLPKYKQGDMLYIIDKGMSNYSGQLCIVVHNGQTYFKKVYTEDDGLRLVSLNEKYSDIFIEYPPAEDTYIKIYDVIGSFTPIEM